MTREAPLTLIPNMGSVIDDLLMLDPFMLTPPIFALTLGPTTFQQKMKFYSNFSNTGVPILLYHKQGHQFNALHQMVQIQSLDSTTQFNLFC